MADQQARQNLIEIASSLYQRGYATGSAGNISLLLEDNTILATPTGACLGRLQPKELSKLTLSGEHIGGNKPSKEVKFHLGLYHNNPSCKAVVHLHSLYLTALSCLSDLNYQNAIKPFTPYVVMRMGDVPVIPYYKPGDIQIATELSKLAANHQAFLLANHGAVTIGNSIQDATNNYEELEETAKLIFILKDRKIKYLTEDEIKELRK